MRDEGVTEESAIFVALRLRVRVFLPARAGLHGAGEADGLSKLP